MVRSPQRLARRVFLALLLLVLAACTKRTSPAVRTATRVVSLSPSTTEAMFAIGAGNLLFGRSTFCDYPPEVKALPIVGGYTNPNLEGILALKPDLVVGARGPAGSSFVEKLEGLGVATYFPETESLAQIDAMLVGLGERTGHGDDAKALVSSMQRGRQAIADAASKEPRKKALLVFGISPLFVAGPGSFADEMLRSAGAENAVTRGKGYPQIDLEMVHTLDPDVILNAAMGEEQGASAITREAKGWRDVRAVKEGNVVELSDVTVLRPGPRVGEGILAISRALRRRPE